MNKLIKLAVVSFSALVFSSTAMTQTQNSKPITLIVPFAPGASADGIARIVGRELSQVLGQPVVVDNKAGAGGALGLISVAKSAADGLTIGLGATGAIAVNPHLPDSAPLQPQKDLMPLAKSADIPLVFVTSTASGYGNLQAFIKAARKAPGGLSYATSGQYTSQHLSGELLATLTSVTMVPIPYRGSGPAVTDLLGGMVPAAMVDLTSAYPHVKSGKLVALGITSAKRSKVAPELPTLAEEGVDGYAAPAWMGLFLPAKTPIDIRNRLSLAIQKVMANPSVQSQIEALAAEPAYLEPKAFGDFIAAESKKWGAMVSKIQKTAK
jgi:tripartite-type tricarboxylate transporter receptor subunit TctC